MFVLLFHFHSFHMSNRIALFLWAIFEKCSVFFLCLQSNEKTFFSVEIHLQFYSLVFYSCAAFSHKPKSNEYQRKSDKIQKEKHFHSHIHTNVPAIKNHKGLLGVFGFHHEILCFYCWNFLFFLCLT